MYRKNLAEDLTFPQICEVSVSVPLENPVLLSEEVGRQRNAVLGRSNMLCSRCLFSLYLDQLILTQYPNLLLQYGSFGGMTQ